MSVDSVGFRHGDYASIWYDVLSRRTRLRSVRPIAEVAETGEDVAFVVELAIERV